MPSKEAWKQHNLVRKFSRLSAKEHLEHASEKILRNNIFDALINTAGAPVLLFLAERDDLSPAWRWRAMAALDNKDRSDNNRELRETVMEIVLNDKSTPDNVKNAVRLRRDELSNKYFEDELKVIAKSGSPHVRDNDIRQIIQDIYGSQMPTSYENANHPIRKYFSLIVGFLISDERTKPNQTKNLELIREFMALRNLNWNLEQTAVCNWNTASVASFLLICVGNIYDFRKDYKSILDLILKIARDLDANGFDGPNGMLEKASAERIRRQERLVIEQESAEREEERRQAQRKRNTELIIENKKREARKEYCRQLVQKARESQPWPYFLSDPDQNYLESLKTMSDVKIESDRISFYESVPFRMAPSRSELQYEKSLVKAWLEKNRTSKSVLESFTREYPSSKMSLIEHYWEFSRYLDHKKRYLVDAIWMEIGNDLGTIKIRIDQVALSFDSELNEFVGCWVVSVFGLNPILRQAITEMDWKNLRKADFLRKITISDSNLKVLEDIFYVQTATSERARTRIGFLLEFLEISLGLETIAVRLLEKRLTKSEESRRSGVFEVAFRNTYWKGERTSGPGLYSCGRCQREIWDPPSIARGFGPCCWRKVKYTEQGRFVLSTSNSTSTYDSFKDRVATPSEIWINSLLRDIQEFSAT